MGKKKGASIIFVNSKGEVLLLLRDKNKDIPFPNHWDVLGGNVEENETPKECIRREMKEEIELDLRNPELINQFLRLGRKVRLLLSLEGRSTLAFVSIKYLGPRFSWGR